ncbi:MlaD family protein [Sulfurisoma sediminicola]|uniref:ABC-type transporter Mla subunit MlaD n=1 Tax=Sulfurisoma sediminicola TaxID=1381557 RepID=A0A497XM38_9PROT|nr:MlaD family protein [Sulfurisoma sediminicola]RLJ67588.1 ABC-type transporter Mla subunit MlaD [Sulfurisoma sediminicola]
MSRKASPTLIGAFVLGAIVLSVATTLLLAGGGWFGEKRQHTLYFEGAAQGLQVGAPVMFLGVKVGTVQQIQLGLDAHDNRFVVPVTIEVLPNVVRARGGEAVDLRDRAVVRGLVERGLRARLRMQSLLTGQLYIDLDFLPDKPARFVALDPDVSEIPTVRTAVQELQTRLESFPMEKFLADVTAISGAVNALMSAQGTQELPQRLQATLKHLESLAARLDAQGGPVLDDAKKALVAAQRALARLEAASDHVATLTATDSDMVKNLTQAADELARAAAAVRSLTAQESPTVQGANAALKEIARAADALRLLAETLEQQPDAVWRGKRKKTD